MSLPMVKTEIIEHVDCPPRRREVVTEVTVPRKVVEHIVEVPETRQVERTEEIQVPVKAKRLVPVPKFRVEDRIIKVPKPIIKEQVIEIPDIQWVEKVIEVPQYVYRERRIEVVRPVVSERIVPITPPIVRERVHGPAAIVAEHHPPAIAQVKRPVVYEEHIHRPSCPQMQSADGVETVLHAPTHVYPHPSHMVMMPSPLAMHPHSFFETSSGRRSIAYRHIPHLMQYPIPHYRPVPVERPYRKKIPLPVHLEIDQEIEHPQIRPRYIDVPVNFPEY